VGTAVRIIACRTFGLLMYVLDKGDRLKGIAAMPDPQETLLYDDTPIELNGRPAGAFTESDHFALTVLLHRGRVGLYS
jgi:hypothetical protein